MPFNPNNLKYFLGEEPETSAIPNTTFRPKTPEGDKWLKQLLLETSEGLGERDQADLLKGDVAREMGLKPLEGFLPPERVEPPVKLEPVPIDFDRDEILANAKLVTNKEVPSEKLTEFDVFTVDTPLGKRVVRPDIQVTVPEPSDFNHFLNTVVKTFGHSAVDLYQSINTMMGYIGEAITPSEVQSTIMQNGVEVPVTRPVTIKEDIRGFNEKVNQEFSDMLDSYLPTQDDDSFWKTKFASGVGSVLFFLAGGVGGRLGNISAKITSSLLGAGTMSQQMYEEAIQGGATEEEALVNYLAGGVLGSSEGLLGVGRFLDQIGKRSGKSLIKQFMTGGLEEFSQELPQTIGNNATVQQTYDLSRDLLEGAEDSGAIALMLGGLTNGGIAGINKILETGKAKGKDITDDERVLLEQALNNFAEVQQKYFSKIKEPSKPTNYADYESMISEIVNTHNKDRGSSHTSFGKVREGFAVGTQEGTTKEIRGSQVTEEQIREFVEENKEELANPARFVGTWYDQKTDKTHLDISESFKNEEDAIKQGRKLRQKAIYDLKNDQDIEILPESEVQIRERQNDIPAEHSIPVYHFSDETTRGMVTDPSQFPMHSSTTTDAKLSPEPRTFFYVDPRSVTRDSQRLQQGNLFIGNVDIRKIYDAKTNPKKYGFEDGVYSIDRMMQEAREAGWEGIKYRIKDDNIINMFTPVYIERTGATPSMGEILSGKWDQSVNDAKSRLNSGAYGSQLFDVTTLPVVGARFISDVGMIMADKIITTEGARGLGTPKEFAKRLIDEFGTEYPAVRRFAREIYEYANSIKNTIKDTPVPVETLSDAMISIDKHLRAGKTGEYIPTGRGAIILGGDIADFEGGERKHIGIDFPKDQALMRVRAKDGTDMRTVAIKDMRTGKVHHGKSTMHFLLIQELEEKGIFTSEETREYENREDEEVFEDGFVDYEGKFYNREETEVVTGEFGESYSQGVAIHETDSPKERAILEKRLARAQLAQEESYPVWATSQGVAKQISQSATVMGNDTLIFMVYPHAWDSVKDNYSFHEELSYLLGEELEFEDIPRLPNFSAWTEGAVQSVRKPYIKKVKEAIAKVKKTKKHKVAREQWNLDAIAYKFGIENGINLTGKIKGVGKFRQINQDLREEGGIDERKAPHKLYDTEIEGYNYQELDDPIDFSYVEKETKGTDIGNQGRIKEMTGEQKELFRTNQVWRNIHQRGQTVTQGQSDLINSLIMYSEGDHTALNQWLQQNPNSQGEIVDQQQHDKWHRDNKKTSEQLRNEANKKLSDLIKPKGSQDTSITLMGGIPFFSPDFWKSLGVVGKAIGRGAKGFTKWAQEMVKTLGEWIKPALRQLYSYINQLPNIIKPVSKKKLDYETSNEDITTDPAVEEAKNKERDHPKGTLPAKTKGYNMNREHPKLAEVLIPAVEAMRQEFDERRRGTITNEELLESARRNAEKLTDGDVWDIKKGDVRNAEDIVALRVFVTDKMLKVADELKKLSADNSVIEIKDASDQLVEVMRMWQVLRGVGTELGRGVQSFNIPMTEDLLEAFQSSIKAINSIDPDNKMGGGIIQEMMEDMAKLKTDTPEKRKSVLEWIRYVFLNWILQNPLTDIANIHGNLTHLGFHIYANIGNLGGMKTLANGIKLGFKEGRGNALRILHGEQEAISKFTEGSNIDMPASKKRSWKNYFRLLVPTTRLGIEDAFFRSMAKNVETQRMVKKTSRDLGVSPDEVFTSVSNIINDPEIAKFERKEYRELVKYLEQIEDQLVFQQELGMIGKGFSKISRVAFPIIPFVTTPTNILKAGMGASPLGLVKLLKKDLGQEERNQIIRKALAGSSLLAGMATLISQGLMEITGSGSDDAFERDLMEKMGYKPNHLYINTPFGKFGGSYMNVNPMNTVMSVMGDMFDKYRFKKFSKDPESDLQWYNKVAQDLSTGLLAIGKSVTEQSYLRGVREMMDAFSGRNPDWFMRTLTGYARVGAIQGIQRIAGIEDRGRYVTRGRADEQIQKNFPLTSNEGLIESISAFGEQRQSQYERFPFPFTKVADDNAYAWMEQEGLTLTIPSRGTKLENRKMNRKEYEMFTRSVGTIMDETVQKLYEQQTDPDLPADKKLSLEKLQDKLDAVYSKAKTAVKKQIKEAIFKQLNEGLK
jgi:hypothetical protein